MHIYCNICSIILLLLLTIFTLQNHQTNDAKQASIKVHNLLKVYLQYFSIQSTVLHNFTIIYQYSICTSLHMYNCVMGTCKIYKNTSKGTWHRKYQEMWNKNYSTVKNNKLCWKITAKQRKKISAGWGKMGR